MTVSDLQQHLADLGRFLEAAGAKGVAGELRAVHDALTPFAGRTAKQFADFLHKAEAAEKNGFAPPPPKPKAPKPVAAEPSQVGAAVRALYDRVTDPSLDRAAVERELSAIDKLRKNDLVIVGGAIDLVGLGRLTIPVIIATIKSKVLDRYDSARRTEAMDRTPPAHRPTHLPAN